MANRVSLLHTLKSVHFCSGKNSTFAPSPTFDAIVFDIINSDRCFDWMDYRGLAREKVVWGFGVLLVPGLVGWAMALFSVVNDMNSTGNKVGLACSFPPALQIALAIDGNWAPILVSVLGSLIIAGVLFAMWNAGARSKISGLASTGREYASSILTKGKPVEGVEFPVSDPTTGASTTKFRILKIIGLFGGGILTIIGSFGVWFAWQHRPVADSLAGAADALFNRGLGVDGWFFHEGPFYVVMGVAVVAIVWGLISFTAALISILWKRI